MKLLKLIPRMFGGRRDPVAGQWRFSDLQKQYLDRLVKWPMSLPKPQAGAKVGVLVTPWLTTPVPFFSLECARMLAGRGLSVTLLWDASNVFLNAAKSSEVAAVDLVFKVFAGHLRSVDVATLLPSADAELGWVNKLVYENAVRSKKGEGAALAFLEAHPECLREMTAHAGRIHSLLAQEQFDWLLIPGGVWAASGLYAQVARDLGVSFTAYDSGVGDLYVAHNGPAAHFADIPVAVETVVPQADAAQRQRMIEQAWGQLQIRREGRDVFRLQPVSTEAARKAAPYHLVVPLNLRSDTAALFRQRLFSSVTDWLTQLLAWLVTQPDVRIAIRQHPCERIPQYRGSDSWAEILAPFAELGDRVLFVGAEDPINTYDLIDGCSVVLPFTSRVGIEAAMLGKPVILGTHCYYQDCGFVQNPATPAEYFQMVGEALRGGLVPSAAARDAAATVYYLAELCLPLATNFTPQPSDYQQWVAMPPEQIWATSQGADLAEALITRQPVACVQHRRLTAL